MRSIFKYPIALILTTSVVIGIPAALAGWLGHPVQTATSKNLEAPLHTHLQLPDAAHDLSVHLYLNKKNKVITIPLEQYVKGVVAAEMPATFNLDALKAQAVAARTNLILLLSSKKKTTDGADITDDYHNSQAYLSDEDLKKQWGKSFLLNMEKVTDAVADTQTEILTYQGQPIDAKFFSTSNGKTESSLAYWGKVEPYLQSIACPWDQTAPHQTDQVSIPLSEVLAAITGSSAVPVLAQNKPMIQVLSETDSHRVSKLRVGNEVITGPDFRSRLNAKGISLNSTDFTVTVANGEANFVTHGYGHGVGMSQYGANGMAQAGKSYQEILNYFYQGVQLVAYPKGLR